MCVCGGYVCEYILLIWLNHREACNRNNVCNIYKRKSSQNYVPIMAKWHNCTLSPKMENKFNNSDVAIHIRWYVRIYLYMLIRIMATQQQTRAITITKTHNFYTDWWILNGNIKEIFNKQNVVGMRKWNRERIHSTLYESACYHE